MQALIDEAEKNDISQILPIIPITTGTKAEIMIQNPESLCVSVLDRPIFAWKQIKCRDDEASTKCVAKILIPPESVVVRFFREHYYLMRHNDLGYAYEFGRYVHKGYRLPYIEPTGKYSLSNYLRVDQAHVVDIKCEGDDNISKCPKHDCHSIFYKDFKHVIGRTGHSNLNKDIFRESAEGIYVFATEEEAWNY
jgi:hypothetical protein